MSSEEYMELGGLILKFSGLMIKRLVKENKPPCLQLNIQELVRNLIEMVKEFNEAYTKSDKETMSNRLIDIANYCALLYFKINKDQNPFNSSTSL